MDDDLRQLVNDLGEIGINHIEQIDVDLPFFWSYYNPGKRYEEPDIEKMKKVLADEDLKIKLWRPGVEDMRPTGYSAKMGCLTNENAGIIEANTDFPKRVRIEFKDFSLEFIFGVIVGDLSRTCRSYIDFDPHFNEAKNISDIAIRYRGLNRDEKYAATKYIRWSRGIHLAKIKDTESSQEWEDKETFKLSKIFEKKLRKHKSILVALLETYKEAHKDRHGFPPYNEPPKMYVSRKEVITTA